jgi:hypothetical protein
MMVHVTENFYIPDTSGVGENMIRIADDSNRFWIAFWNGGIARICVALFMIVSAFLLVPMKEGVGMAQFHKKRFLRIFPPMLFFMVLYSILPAIWGDFSWEQSWKFLKGIPLNFPEYAYHLWFMYPLISLYLFIPIISPWLEKASAKDERIFLFIFALSTLMPFIHKLTPYTYIFGECWWNGFHMFWYFSGYIGYLVMAHYIHKHIDWSTSKRMLIGSTCFVIGSAYTFGSHFSMTSADTPPIVATHRICLGILHAECTFSLIRCLHTIHLHQTSESPTPHYRHQQTFIWDVLDACVFGWSYNAIHHTWQPRRTACPRLDSDSRSLLTLLCILLCDMQNRFFLTL